jgi:hypothetical protein
MIESADWLVMEPFPSPEDHKGGRNFSRDLNAGANVYPAVSVGKSIKKNRRF